MQFITVNLQYFTGRKVLYFFLQFIAVFLNYSILL